MDIKGVPPIFRAGYIQRNTKKGEGVRREENRGRIDGGAPTGREPLRWENRAPYFALIGSFFVDKTIKKQKKAKKIQNNLRMSKICCIFAANFKI